jgi:ATP-dependent RNA helicase RhlB
MLFSATLSHRVLELAYEHMNDPELIRIEPERVTADRVRQVIYYPAMEEKAPLLVHLLRTTAATRTMVFVNTKRLAERLERVLRANGIVAAAMSSDVPQRKRMRMLREFHEGKLAVLVATDVAARGLHIPDVSHVFNYDLPQDAQDYVHRIGRTARAGAAGDAVSFGCEQYVVSLPDIESFIGNRIPVASIDPAALPLLKPAHLAPRQDEGDDDDGTPPPRHRRRPEQGRTDHRGDRPNPQSVTPRPERSAIPVLAAPMAPVQAPADQTAPARKHRRRRRRHGGGRPDGGPQGPPAD